MRVERSYRLRGKPAVGETIQAEGRDYDLIGVYPYISRRGRKSHLYEFRGRCPQCGSAFKFVSARSAFWPIIHCPKHRPGQAGRGGQ